MSSQIVGANRVTYTVYPENLTPWTLFYIKGLGGVGVPVSDTDVPPRVEDSIQQQIIAFPHFDLVLQADPNTSRDSHLNDELAKFGDHCLCHVDIAVEDLAGFRMLYGEILDQLPPTLAARVHFVSAQGQSPWNIQAAENGALLNRIDHLTFVCHSNQVNNRLKIWKGFGSGRAKVIRVNRGNGRDKNLDSLLLRTVVFNKGQIGREIGIAIACGTDGRTEISQVNMFIAANGVDEVQHIAFDVPDIKTFYKYFVGTLGGNLMDEPVVVVDKAGGLDAQVFALPFSGRNAAEGQYAEYRARNLQKEAGIEFRQFGAVQLHDMVRRASKRPPKPMINFGDPRWNLPVASLRIPRIRIPTKTQEQYE